MLKSSTTVLLLASLLVCIAEAQATAQERSLHFDLQSFHPTATAGGLFTLEGTEIGTHLRPRGALQLSYLHDPLIYEGVGGEDIEAISSRLIAELSLSMGAFNRFEVGLALPVIFYQGGQESLQLPRPSATGIGDLRLVPKVRLRGHGLAGLSLALLAAARFPTANEDALGGSGGAFEPALVLGYRRAQLSLHASAGYRLQQARRLFNLAVSDQLLFSAGALYRIHSISALAELTVASAASSPFTERQRTPLQAMFGARYARSGFTATVGIGPGIVPGFGAPQVEIFTALAYAPWGVDSDGDRVPDEVDGCPLVPEDRDGFEDNDGCPDPDNDHDGILDEDDKCPNEAEDKDGFEDEDGCPDLDNDRDGIPDSRDRCPNEPEDKDGFEDEDGCPDSDNDRDGILDKEDKCPDEPETVNGIEDDDGCPEADRDKDGILDKDDKCPDVPEDKDGIEDEDGCPEDRDGDKIPDDKDKCPDEPETYNGYEDDDGCPDEVKPRVEFRKSELWTSEAIYFDNDKWVIRPRFRAILKKVAEAIIANKQIHVVYIEGHTDAQGSENYNQWLSFYRAEEVLLALRKLGVPRTKIRAMGRGAEQPVDTNVTSQGMARNRRVVFHVEYKAPKEKKPVAP
jgi:large repetitive protein